MYKIVTMVAVSLFSLQLFASVETAKGLAKQYHVYYEGSLNQVLRAVDSLTISEMRDILLDPTEDNAFQINATLRPLMIAEIASRRNASAVIDAFMEIMLHIDSKSAVNLMKAQIITRLDELNSMELTTLLDRVLEPEYNWVFEISEARKTIQSQVDSTIP